LPASLPRSTPGATQVGFESDLPLATGVSTTTFDLPKSMAMSMKQSTPKVAADRSLSDRFEAFQQAEMNGKLSPGGAGNGAKFDLAQAAALDRRANSKQASNGGDASGESLARLIAANAGAVPSVGTNSAKGADEASEKKPLSRFSQSQRRTPAWTRNHARWRQGD
jgi:hypothetical protein